jgi:hypothetical protein
MTNIDYNKIVIYKIVCKDSNVKDVYVGCTTRFNERQREHKKRCNNEKYKEYNFKVYKTIRDNGGWDNFEMVQIIKQPCKDSAEAHALERYYYELLNSTMNTTVPNRTPKEYDKEYKEINKDKIKQYKKEYYQNEYKEQKKDKIKQYQNENKDKIKIYQHEYKLQNKDKLKQYRHEYNQMKREHKANLQKINHIKYKQDKILNYESNETRDETLKQILNI